MNAKLQKYIDPVKNAWGKLSKKAKRIIFIVLGCIVAASVVLGLALNRQTPYTVLYSGLGTEEAQQVTTKIQEAGVQCKNDDGTIYVPEDKEDSLRMQLASDGYPKTTLGYDFFLNNINTMTPDGERKIIEQYGLQDRLQKIIETLDPIASAYVTITIPSTETYAWDESSEKATASVTVKVKSSASLSAAQVNGIKNLVATSVPNLTTDNVSITDSSGEELSADSSGVSNGTQIDMSEFKLKIESQYEKNIENKIIALLSPSYGKKNVTVSVKSQMDLDKKIQDIITYNPTTSDNKGIISKSQESDEVTKNASSTGGVAGTESNSDTTTYPGVTVDGNTITAKDSKTYEYLVSKVQEQIQSEAASLKDLTVSVIINSPAMTDQTKSDIAGAVANAAGVAAEKVVVLNSTFATSTKPVTAAPQQSVPTKYLIMGGAALLLMIILLAFIIIASKKKKKRARAIAENLGLEAAAGQDALPRGEKDAKAGKENVTAVPNQSIEEIRSHTNEKEEHVKQDLQEFSSKNPEIAAQLIRNWLRGDDGNDKQ
ncbi:MAG TPA: flagellar M-ring protein FliF [Ruminococcaceae bacterium]|nr:flagellar M-ring protein FliF [Oscillospiraceae bacterium]